MHALYTLSVFLHVLAACTWIGSMIFFAAAVVPAIRRPEYAAVMPKLVRIVGKRFRVLGWVSLSVLVLTGTANLFYFRGFGLSELSTAAFWRTDFGQALGWKLAFVTLVLVATAAHDALSSRQTPGARRLASWLGRATLLLSIAALLFAVRLVR
jgi:uncharacterized membrane protein